MCCIYVGVLMFFVMLINWLGSLKLIKVRGVWFDSLCFIFFILIFVIVICIGILKINKIIVVFCEKLVCLIRLFNLYIILKVKDIYNCDIIWLSKFGCVISLIKNLNKLKYIDMEII